MYLHKIYINKIHRLINPDRFEQTKEIARWYADGGDKVFRYNYPLTKESIVIDAGAYHGEWTAGIYKKYHCNIYAFEPVTKYYNFINKIFGKNKKIHLYKVGLGGKNRTERIYLDEVASSIYKKGAKPEEIKIIDIKKFCDKNKLEEVDLIKINIEGGEYELLNRIIDSGLINRIKYVQVQFHNFIPDAEAKMLRLQRKLSKTHRQRYSYWFIWDSWERK